MGSEVAKVLADLGMGGFATFLDFPHHDVHPGIDPTQVTLPGPFVVCVMGASRGIGAGIAHAYARAGVSGLVLASRRVSGLEQTAAECREINPSIHIDIIPCDITSDSSVRDLASKTQSKFGRLDVLAINSGFSGKPEPKVTETPTDVFVNATNVNYVGTFLCAKYFIPLLVSTEDGAKAIIAVNSVATLITRGVMASPSYCVSKTAQFRLMQMIHEQHHATDGLVCYTMHPGGVATELALSTAPEFLHGYLTDSPELCGAFCVWLTKDREHHWLSGRFSSVTWDTEQLDAKKQLVVEKDLLKLSLGA
ncbi:hypothetical protein LTR53_006338 [Teratosphaeriaceae sp. CCFEE 6253]|nr:hypothetical protein LTR53_006338 [Teratosphaeriaceae sp. CCFEE 6253]